jgi:hypothetical protein
MSISVNNIGQVANIFINLTKELEPFVKTDDLKIAFGTDGKAYLIGDDFTEVINANFAAVQDVKNSLRILIAKHRSQYKPEQ